VPGIVADLKTYTTAADPTEHSTDLGGLNFPMVVQF